MVVILFDKLFSPPEIVLTFELLLKKFPEILLIFVVSESFYITPFIEILSKMQVFALIELLL